MPGRVPADQASGPTSGPRESALGLDELMIVNPTPDSGGGIFLGEDGTLYQVQGLGAEEGAIAGALFLGEDGTLYRAEGVADPAATTGAPSPPPAAAEMGLSGYLLGADGTLYEITG
jgi:hypothetical protein